MDAQKARRRRRGASLLLLHRRSALTSRFDSFFLDLDLDLSQNKKKLLAQVKADTDWVQLLQDNPWLSSTKLVVKPDMLFGKRGKNGKGGGGEEERREKMR
jgi:hypothetical protein